MVCVCCQPQSCEDCCVDDIEEVEARFTLELDGVPCCINVVGSPNFHNGSPVTSIDETFTLVKTGYNAESCRATFEGQLCFGPSCDTVPGLFGDNTLTIFLFAYRSFATIDGVPGCYWQIDLRFGFFLPKEDCALSTGNIVGAITNCCPIGFQCGSLFVGFDVPFFFPAKNECSGTQSTEGSSNFGFSGVSGLCRECDGEVNGDWTLSLTW
jgi:hypothetical protein